jgi:hypothetical protein
MPSFRALSPGQLLQPDRIHCHQRSQRTVLRLVLERKELDALDILEYLEALESIACKESDPNVS